MRLTGIGTNNTPYSHCPSLTSVLGGQLAKPLTDSF